MRELTEEELKLVIDKLTKFVGASIKEILEREDEKYVLRLHKEKVFYAREELVKIAMNFGKDELLSVGTCLGKFTKTRKFRLQITSLDIIARYGKYKIWVKQNGEQSFIYGNHVVKSYVARMTEGTPANTGVIIYSLSDLPLGFGVTAKSTIECRDLDPTAIVALNQCDIGEYLRMESDK